MQHRGINIFGVLLILTVRLHAQEFIILQDSLTLNSERLEVKMGGLALGKIKNFGFGNYTIITSKAGESSGSEKSNLFGTKSESRSSKKLSFDLSNGGSDVVSVSAESTSIVQSQNQFEVAPGFHTGTEQSSESNSLLAVITLHGDSSKGWRLIFGMGRAPGKVNAPYETILTNGEREIWLTPATSDKDFDFSKANWTSKIPAMGFEFKENGLSIGAVQHIGGGSMMTSMNPKGCKVWIHKKPDPKMKLVLAAAMTTILLMQSPASPVH